MNVLIRADASMQIGIGHVMRCLTLADELKVRGAKTCFICRAILDHMKEKIKERGHDIIVLPVSDKVVASETCASGYTGWLGADWQRDAEETAHAIVDKRYDLLITDHYAIDVRWHKHLRGYVNTIMAIDDLANRPHDCDLLLDQTFGREESDYFPYVPGDCKIIVGSHYALLRNEFSLLRDKAIERRKRFTGIRRILVAMGGTDPANMTSIILKMLGKVVWTVKPEIEVVLSSEAPHISEVKQDVQGSELGVTLVTDVKDMNRRILNTDLAFGAGGTTSWERCVLGLPTILLMTASNQIDVATRLADAGAIALPAGGAVFSLDEIKHLLQQLVNSDKAWKRMSNQAFRVADGLGVKRISILLDPPHANDGLPVYLRPATMGDADLMYSWQSDKNTRRFSHNQGIPEYSGHKEWLDEKISDAHAYTEIILHGDMPAGVIRLDPVEAGSSATYLISIYISPDSYRMGLAKAALEIMRYVHQYAELRAEVHEQNKASHALFKSVGFLKIGESGYVSPPVLLH